MKSSSLASRSDALVCPPCEVSRLRPSGRGTSRCESCGATFEEAFPRLLNQIVGLPDVMRRHACECGHPEMRHLPDGTYHCPACGSEIVPIDAPPFVPKSGDRGKAYWAGWLDGRLGGAGSFATNHELSRWQSPHDRLDYYHGHRDGRDQRGAQP